VISLKEEAEQAIVEQSVELDADSNTLWAKLPFIEDPVTALKPNRFVAERVLKSQLAILKRSLACEKMRSSHIRSCWTEAM
jgi:hypothetical protein